MTLHVALLQFASFARHVGVPQNLSLLQDLVQVGELLGVREDRDLFLRNAALHDALRVLSTLDALDQLFLLAADVEQSDHLVPDTLQLVSLFLRVHSVFLPVPDGFLFPGLLLGAVLFLESIQHLGVLGGLALDGLTVESFLFTLLLSLVQHLFHELALVVMHQVAAVEEIVALLLDFGETLRHLLIHLRLPGLLQNRDLLLILPLSLVQLVLDLEILVLQILDVLQVLLALHVVLLFDALDLVHQFLVLLLQLPLYLVLVLQLFERLPQTLEYLDLLVRWLRQYLP